MDPLAQKVAEMALRLSAMPAGGLRRDTAALDAIEQLAVQVLKEVAAARTGKTYAPGEISGMWRAVTHPPRQ